jgi:Fic family protein
MARVTGRYESSTAAGVRVNAYVPLPLPPADPPLALSEALQTHLRRAESAVQRLDWVTPVDEGVGACAASLTVKEAVVSVAMAGGSATIASLLTYEAERAGYPDNPPEDADARSVHNYLDAVHFARDARSKHPQPLNEAHRLLLRSGGDDPPEPVGIRSEQNWVADETGRATYVPPPPSQLPATLGAFQRYLQARDGLAPLIRIGLLHVQFDTIHPYLHGNGRMGRLLITLLLEHWGILRQPSLYLSVYLRQHQAEYQRRLQAVRVEGDWEGWLAFFLDGVATVAEHAVATIQDMRALAASSRARVLEHHAASVVSLQLLEVLPRHPVVTGRSVVQILEITRPTSGKAIDVLEDCGVLVEVTGRMRDRVYHYGRYLDRLGQELGD